MTPDEFKARLDKAIGVIHKKLPDLIDENALNQKALFRARVTQEGLNVDTSGTEVAFPDYSAGYKKKKAKVQGESTPNRLLLSGDMLRKLNISKRELQEGKYTVTLGGTDAFSQQKLNYNGEHYGDILKPSNKEVEIMQDAFIDSIVDILNEVLGK
jgi:hypothetical protein